MHGAAEILFVGFLVFLAHILTALFGRTKVPDVLMLILLGVAVGPFLHLVSPEDFGAVGPVFVTITLIIILFEGGIGLKLKDLYKTLRGMLSLTIVTYVSAAAAAGIVTHFYWGMDLFSSMLLGAVLGAISPTVIIPLVRQLKMRKSSATLLTMESATSEVLSIVVVLAFVEAYKPGQLNVGFMIGRIISSFLAASVIGVVSAAAWSTILHKVRSLENSLFTTPAFVFIIYGLTELLGFNGVISSLAFGITLGNIGMFDFPFVKRYISVDPISLNRAEKVFFSEVVFLLKTFFFFYVGISMQLTDVNIFGFGALLTVVFFALRIPAVRLTLDKSHPRDDVAITAVMVPKGLATAVLGSIPLQQGFPEGVFIQDVTYSVVLLSIVLTSALIFMLDKTPLAGAYGWLFSDYKPVPPPKLVNNPVKQTNKRA